MTQQKVDTVRLQRMVRAYRESGALMAAVELGLFTKVARGADTEAKLIEALGIQPLNAERIVIACIGLGLIVREGDRIANAPDVARFLVEGEPGYAGAWMLFTKPDWNHWGHLKDFLATTEPPMVENKTVAGITIEEARRYHAATYSIGMGAGRRFVRLVDLSGRKRMMDLGGGSGAYCIQACRQWPDLTAVVCDLPAVVVVARAFIAENGMSERVEAIECDFVNDPLPTGCDVAVMASNLPMYGREVIAAVIAKAHDALLPGGEFHLIGEALDRDRTGTADAALWGLAQTLNNTTGLAHSVGECEDYLLRAGFTNVSTSDFVPGVLVRTSGRKAG